MNKDELIAGCTHQRVIYQPIGGNAMGWTPRWVCDCCSMEFAPRDMLAQAVRDDCAYATRHCDNYKCRDGTQEVVWHCPRCGNVGPTTAANLELAIKEKTWPKKKNQAR